MEHVTDRTFELAYRGHRLRVRIDGHGALELYLNGCLRKRREPRARAPAYVWTNVELAWEEHHLIEARLDPGRSRLEVTANGALLLERCLE